MVFHRPKEGADIYLIKKGAGTPSLSRAWGKGSIIRRSPFDQPYRATSITHRSLRTPTALPFKGREGLSPPAARRCVVGSVLADLEGFFSAFFMAATSIPGQIRHPWLQNSYRKKEVFLKCWHNSYIEKLFLPPESRNSPYSLYTLRAIIE